MTRILMTLALNKNIEFVGSRVSISGCLSACNGDEVIVQHISQHGKTWPYWFRKMGQSVAATLLFVVKQLCLQTMFS